MTFCSVTIVKPKGVFSKLFQLIVLGLQTTTLLFWFSLAAVIRLVSNSSR